MSVAPSASAISRLNRNLDQEFMAWRERRVQEHDALMAKMLRHALISARCMLKYGFDAYIG